MLTVDTKVKKKIVHGVVEVFVGIPFILYIKS